MSGVPSFFKCWPLVALVPVAAGFAVVLLVVVAAGLAVVLLEVVAAGFAVVVLAGVVAGVVVVPWAFTTITETQAISRVKIIFFMGLFLGWI